MGIPAKLKSHQPPIDSPEIPKATGQWTTQELASLAKLVSRRPDEPTAALLRAMKGDA
jgi:hypothetical protein